MPRGDPHEFHRLIPLNNGDVIGRLEVEPEIGRCAEVAGQPGSGIRSNGTALVDNISYAGCGDAEGDGKRMMSIGFKNSSRRISPGCVRTRMVFLLLL